MGVRQMPVPLFRTSAFEKAGPIAGIFWVTLSMALFAGLAAFSRAAMNEGLHPFVILFIRNCLSVTLLSPLLFWRGPDLFRSHAWRLYLGRVSVSFVSMMAWFYSILLIPLGELTAISFLGPLFGTLGAIFFLGERVRWRRWAALVIGFTGAMIILRPSGASIGLGQVCALVSTIAGGLTAVLVKQLTSRDDPDKIVYITNLMLAPLSLVPALFFWTWPTLATLPLLLGVGLCAVLGHVSLVRGYAATDASLAQTFEFSKLPFAVAVGYAAFGEVIDSWTWVGAAIIFGSSVYITNREARLRREALAKAQEAQAKAEATAA